MKIALIAAMGKNRVIGKDNKMPWHLPADLARFKALTLNKPVIMGRKTFESIGKPLPQRRNIILSHQTDLKLSGCEVFFSIEELLQILKDEKEIMIIGGEKIFQQFLPMANYMHLTIIDHEFEGDTFFPQWNSSEWYEISTQALAQDDKNPYVYHFIDLKRIL